MKKTTWKLLCMLMTVVLLFSMLPLSTFAANDQALMIGSTLVTGELAGDVFRNGKVSFNYATNTLTLKNATIDIKTGMYGIDFTAIQAAGMDLTICLIGNNKITTISDKDVFLEDSLMLNYGIVVEKNLTITGNGSLELVTGSNSLLSVGIFAGENLTIKDRASVTVTAGSSDTISAGVLAGQTLLLQDSAQLFVKSQDAGVVSNAVVALKCTLKNGSMLSAHSGNIVINSLILEDEYNNCAISIEETFSVNGGTIVASCGDVTAKVAVDFRRVNSVTDVVSQFPVVSSAYKDAQIILADNADGKRAVTHKMFTTFRKDAVPKYMKVGIISHEEMCGTKDFSDLRPQEWYHESIDYVLARGLMYGVSDTQFAPNDNTTRGQFITVLWRLIGSPAPVGKNPFSDVKSGSFYETAITWGYEKGIVSGISVTHYAPEEKITREQLVSILYRHYTALFSSDIKVSERPLAAFQDAGTISSFAKKPMAWALDNGIIYGVSDTVLQPKGNATRAQMAAFFERFVKVVGLK